MAIDAVPAIKTSRRVAKSVLVPTIREGLTEDRLERRPMTREEYERLPEKPKAEWVNGEAIIMTAPANLRHSDISTRLVVLLSTSLPKLKIRAEAGFRHGQSDRVPDIMAVTPEKAGKGVWVTAAPVLVVEIISPSTRTQDMITKSAQYLKAGVGQYWIADPELETITVLEQSEGAWNILAEFNNENPSGQIQVENYGTVPISLTEILA